MVDVCALFTWTTVRVASICLSDTFISSMPISYKYDKEVEVG